MAVMKVYLYIGVLLCLAMGSKSETSDVFKSVLEPLKELCEPEIGEYTQEDLDSALNLEEPFSDTAMCIINCGMTKLNMIGPDGKLTLPAQYLVPYEKLYADNPERLADALDVITTCYNEVSTQIITNPCEVGVAMIRCTAKAVEGEK